MTRERAENSQNHIELTTPDAGIIDGVFADLLTDRTSFMRQVMEKIKEENYPLVHVLVATTMYYLPEVRDLAFEWALCYYEIYRRAAEKQGKKMIVVSESLVDSLGQQGAIASERALANPKSFKVYLAHEEALHKKSIDVDIKKTKDFVAFWSPAYGNMSMLPERERYFAFRTLFILQNILHEQNEINKFREGFPT